MYNASGRLLGKPRTTSSGASVPGLWTMQQQIEAKRASLWPGAPWTPAEITTALWLDAADASTITESGGAVSQWDDKSGNDLHVSQSTGALQPTYVSNGFNGGYPTIDWGSSTNSKRLFRTSVTWQPGQIAAVMDYDGGSPFPIPRLGIVAIHISIFQFRTKFSSTDFDRPVYLNGASSSAPDALPAVLDPFLFVTDFTGGVGDAIHIGNDRGLTDSGWQGKICEVLVLGTTVSTEDRQKVEGYLAHKWGLTANLPADHPYKSAAPVTG